MFKSFVSLTKPTLHIYKGYTFIHPSGCSLFPRFSHKALVTGLLRERGLVGGSQSDTQSPGSGVRVEVVRG